MTEYTTTNKQKLDDDEARVEGILRFTVPNISKLRETTLSEPVFVRSLPWKIMAMPRQQMNEDDKPANSLGFFLQCNGEAEYASWSCHAAAELRLLSAREGQEPFRRKISHVFNAKENDRGFPHYILFSDLCDPDRGWINVSDDSITLEVCVRASAPQGVKNQVGGYSRGPKNTPVAIPTSLAVGPTYELGQSPHGYCVIISNEHFEDYTISQQAATLKDMPDTSDAAHLDDAFREFGFRVVRLTNLSCEEMRQTFIKYSTINHRAYDMFVMCLLSHGARNAVCGVDGEAPLQISDMLELFTSSRCPQLKDKPKLFFMDMCQRQPTLVADDERNKYRYHVPDQHMLLAYSSLPNKVSYVSPAQGSWYMQALCSNLKEHGDKVELTSLLSRVQGEVAQRKEVYHVDMATGHPVYQTQYSFNMSSLTKGVIFKRNK